MICSCIDICIDYASLGYDNGGQSPKLFTYLLDKSPEIPSSTKRPAVVVCPGGSYAFTSDREAEPVALKYCSEGFHSFVLRYSVEPATFPCALLELSKSIALIREHAQEWNVDPEKIIVCGFSAGGHLTASQGVFWNHDFVKNALDIQNHSCKPNAMILSYPVISSGPNKHQHSFECLLGDQYNEKNLEFLSLENQISSDTPPTFLWHTMEDTCVPVENALLFASSLRKKDIPFELHVYQRGGHGLSLANEVTNNVLVDCQNWIDMSIRWIKDL
jgi:acetyl esterase/lipase